MTRFDVSPKEAQEENGEEDERNHKSMQHYQKYDAKMEETERFLYLLIFRKRLNISWIANDGARRVTLRKRKKGLTKRLSEITTLCNTLGSMVIYTPEKEEPVEVWQDKAKAQAVFHAYMQLPESERNLKTLDAEGLFYNRIAKYRDQLSRIERDNRAKQVDIFALRILQGEGVYGMSAKDIEDLFSMVDTKAELLKATIDTMRNNQPPPPPPPPPSPVVAPEAVPPQEESSVAAEARAKGKSVVVDDDKDFMATYWENIFMDDWEFPDFGGDGSGGDNIDGTRMGDFGASGSGSGNKGPDGFM
ncbi:Agamous-like MADS-box protein AGL80 [Acorus gramineus]|uniref:Agamous-like MADS-box protein AGL80 n=1 Tax=Acorus gramineus TaxID=55184 RepID=A0AAV9BWU4_ACOGR|nr:Agamous-like MADS-box protein AGL80 [Acorus gramineus]